MTLLGGLCNTEKKWKKTKKENGKKGLPIKQKGFTLGAEGGNTRKVLGIFGKSGEREQKGRRGVFVFIRN